MYIDLIIYILIIIYPIYFLYNNYNYIIKSKLNDKLFNFQKIENMINKIELNFNISEIKLKILKNKLYNFLYFKFTKSYFDLLIIKDNLNSYINSLFFS